MPWRVTKQGAKFCVVKISDGAVVACHDTQARADAQRRALYASEDYGLQLAIQDFNLEFAKESDVNLPGGSHNLKNYWVRGPGAAKIRWGTDGSFDRCVRQLGRYVRDPQGLCAEYHKAATGEWPAEKGIPSSGDLTELAEISREERTRLVQEGRALPDGSYPIRNVGDLHNAIQAVGRARNRARAVAFIKKRARELDAISSLPENWDVGDTVTATEEFHGTHNQQDHDPHKGFHVPDISPSDMDKLKSLVGKKPTYPVSKSKSKSKLKRDSNFDEAEYERAIGQRKSSGYDEDDEDEDERDRRSVAAVNGMETAAKKSDCPPGQHKMTDGSCMNDENPDMESYATGDGDEPWEGVLTVEGVESGDGRLFALGGLDWAGLPMPLMYQPANIGGHNGSIMVGNIQTATRHGSRIRGKGVVFGSALAGRYGDDIRHMMETGGVSVDVDKVKDADVEMVYADDESGNGGNMFAKPETTIFHRGRIRGATLVAFPAFVEAKLSFTDVETLTASCGLGGCGCDDTDPLVAAVHTITIPNLPKAEWFNEPTDVKLSGALTITDDGRVYGILAPGNTTHRSVKRRVPRGNVDYSRFHKAETIVEGGGRVVTGVITAACGHAPTENYGTLERRREHYDNSCSVLANVRIGESKQGHIYAAGALNPGADPRQVAQALGCALSGDWQPHPDRPGVQEFISAHLVPVPGFPLARTQASVVYQDGMITASAIPVEHVKTPTYVTGPKYDDTFNAIQMTKRLLVASVGLDPETRKNRVMKELELI